MSETSDYEDLRRYLLGQLPEEEADRLEQRLLLDEDFFELAEAAEAELLDECVRGELAPALCEQLTRRLAASPGGRARLARARGLAEAIAANVANVANVVNTPNVVVNTPNVVNIARPAPEPVQPIRRPGFLARPAVRFALAAGLAGLIVTVWQVERTPQPHPTDGIAQAKPPVVLRGASPTPAPLMAPSTPPRTEAPSVPALPPVQAEKPEKPRAKSFPPAVLVLQVAMTRGGEEGSPNILRIVSPDQRVELQLQLEEGEPYSSYDVSIGREEDGQGVWAKKGLTPTPDSILKIQPPARHLADGSYLVTISGVTPGGTAEEVGYPRFQVVRP